MSDYNNNLVTMIAFQLALQRVRENAVHKGFSDIEKDIEQQINDVRPAAIDILDSMRRLGYLTGKVLQ